MTTQTFLPGPNRLSTLLVVLEAYITALEQAVDAAWESRSASAEELDAQLAAARDRYAEVEAESTEFEDSGELEEPEYHEGVSVEEQLIAAYVQFLANNPRGPFGGRRDCILEHMRGVLEDGARRPILANDEEILAAARDAYEAELARRTRRARPSL